MHVFFKRSTIVKTSLKSNLYPMRDSIVELSS